MHLFLLHEAHLQEDGSKEGGVEEQGLSALLSLPLSLSPHTHKHTNPRAEHHSTRGPTGFEKRSKGGGREGRRTLVQLLQGACRLPVPLILHFLASLTFSPSLSSLFSLFNSTPLPHFHFHSRFHSRFHFYFHFRFRFRFHIHFSSLHSSPSLIVQELHPIKSVFVSFS